MATIIVAFGALVAVMWQISSGTLYWTKVLTGAIDQRFLRPHRWLAAELRPFYLPAALIIISDDVVTGRLWGSGWAIFGDAALLACWWLYKDVDDDDRWKRRRAKVVGKVKALASGRLTVVPAGAS